MGAGGDGWVLEPACACAGRASKVSRPHEAAAVRMRARAIKQLFLGTRDSAPSCGDHDSGGAMIGPSAAAYFWKVLTYGLKRVPFTG